MCAKNGLPLAVVDDAGKLYMVLGDGSQKSEHAADAVRRKKVKVTGTLVEKGGIAESRSRRSRASE